MEKEEGNRSAIHVSHKYQSQYLPPIIKRVALSECNVKFTRKQKKILAKKKIKQCRASHKYTSNNIG